MITILKEDESNRHNFRQIKKKTKNSNNGFVHKPGQKSLLNYKTRNRSSLKLGIGEKSVVSEPAAVLKAEHLLVSGKFVMTGEELKVDNIWLIDQLPFVKVGFRDFDLLI